MSWSDENVEELKKLWADGLSCSQIAGRLGGLTRNSVIGKIHRLGLAGRATTSRLKAGRKPAPNWNKFKGKPKPQPKPFVFSERMDLVKEIHRDGLPIPPPAETDIPRIATVNLEAHHCRFPCVADVKTVGPYAPIYCGLKPVPGLPYCPAHSKRAFVPPRPHTPPATPMTVPVVQEELEAA